MKPALKNTYSASSNSRDTMIKHVGLRKFTL